MAQPTSTTMKLVAALGTLWNLASSKPCHFPNVATCQGDGTRGSSRHAFLKGSSGPTGEETKVLWCPKPRKQRRVQSPEKVALQKCLFFFHGKQIINHLILGHPWAPFFRTNPNG